MLSFGCANALQNQFINLNGKELPVVVTTRPKPFVELLQPAVWDFKAVFHIERPSGALEMVFLKDYEQSPMACKGGCYLAPVGPQHKGEWLYFNVSTEVLSWCIRRAQIMAAKTRSGKQ